MSPRYGPVYVTRKYGPHGEATHYDLPWMLTLPTLLFAGVAALLWSLIAVVYAVVIIVDAFSDLIAAVL